MCTRGTPDPTGLSHSAVQAAITRVQLFSPSANSLYWLAIVGVAGLAVCAPLGAMAWARTPYATGQHELPDQPVKFDHRHHVGDDGIDCLYCHGDARRSPAAGVPSTSVCMGCHNQVWPTSPELALVRQSIFENRPIHWTRVTSLPDFVFFNHSAHVNKGVGCVSCHGRIDEMRRVEQVHPMTMRWCLECHRAPERHLRPLDQITNMEWRPDRPQLEIGREVRKQLGVRSITDCTGCHR